MKINGFEYTESEILDSLRTKGYLILKYCYEATDETFPGGVEVLKIDTVCAVKGAELPSEKNIWENVAIREFQKEFIKPKLI